jgi:hypothetical protein
LEYLVVRGEDSILVNGFSDLKAPKLLRIVLTGMSIERFSAENYPKLTKLVLNECDLRSLRLTDYPSLNYLDICKNPNLTNVESDQLNSLKTLINDNEKIKLEAPNLTRCEMKVEHAKFRYNSQVPKLYGVVLRSQISNRISAQLSTNSETIQLNLYQRSYL